MSATRFFLLTGANVTVLRTVAPDSLNAAADHEVSSALSQARLAPPTVAGWTRMVLSS
jgi:hypothetical protein